MLPALGQSRASAKALAFEVLRLFTAENRTSASRKISACCLGQGFGLGCDSHPRFTPGPLSPSVSTCPTLLQRACLVCPERVPKQNEPSNPRNSCQSFQALVPHVRENYGARVVEMKARNGKVMAECIINEKDTRPLIRRPGNSICRYRTLW